MANDGWSIVKGLRKIGIEADLIINRQAHVASLPQWEDGQVDLERVGDPYTPNWDALNAGFDWPRWLHVWNLAAEKQWWPFSRTIKKTLNWLKSLPDLRRYDLVVGHIPFAKMAPIYNRLFRRPYIIYDAGWIRYLYQDHTSEGVKAHFHGAARRGYKDAAKIIFTNVDTYGMFLENGHMPTQLAYSPFAIDMDLYKPISVGCPYSRPVFFGPSRQDWDEKGNDMLIRAFARYVKNRNPKATLLLVGWGNRPEWSAENDMFRAGRLIHELGIWENVRWLPVMNKRRLIEYLNMADTVCDQYVFGALGTTTPEALSCGKPVIAYADPHLWLQHHGSVPPIAQAQSEQQIYECMIQLEDPTLRRDLGELGRKWIKDTCELTVVAKKQLKIYREVLD